MIIIDIELCFKSFTGIVIKTKCYSSLVKGEAGEEERSGGTGEDQGGPRSPRPQTEKTG